MTANRGSILSILFTGLADVGERVVTAEHRATEPDGELLHHVLCHCALHRVSAAVDRVVDCHTLVKNFLHLRLQTSVKSLEKCGTTREHNIVVEFDSILDGAALNGVIYDFT